MSKLVTGVVAAVIVAASAITLLGASLAGVTLPDSTDVGGKTLVLNGLGLRTKFMVKVYVAGLYLDAEVLGRGAIIKADAPKQVVMHFVRGVSKEQMVEAFDESFQNNAPDALKTMKADVDRLLGAFEPLKEGDQMVFTLRAGHRNDSVDRRQGQGDDCRARRSHRRCTPPGSAPSHRLLT